MTNASGAVVTRQALDQAGISAGDVQVLKTHTPFAVDDIYFRFWPSPGAERATCPTCGWEWYISWAGFDHLIIKGQATAPVYLWIHDGEILLLDEFDRSGKTLAEVQRTLKLRHIHRGFRKIRTCRSYSEDLIQIADLAAGAVLRCYAKGDDRAYQALRPKVQTLLEFWKQNPPD